MDEAMLMALLTANQKVDLLLSAVGTVTTTV
jgi:hypothetical protein